ncbi:MAG: hypothetical protein GY783_00525, partial [Gammaproteobacteria bacterium]|nr:hypothetical protein [Gammaproteobacteria bacterium]
MVDKRTRETLGIVTGSAICTGGDMVSRIRFSQCVYYVALNMAGLTGLNCRINQSVVELAIEIETIDIMAYSAIHTDQRMAIHGTDRVITIMTGVTATSDNRWLQMIGKGANETFGIVTGPALEICVQMGCMLSCSNRPVVARGTECRNIAMVVATVGLQLDEMARVMAGVALGVCLQV